MKQLYAYSPHTFEYIKTNRIFDWMGTTTKKPPTPKKDNESAFFIDDKWQLLVIEHPLSEEEARQKRDSLLNEVLWLVDRHNQQLQINVETTLSSTEYTNLLLYIQALRDVPEQPEFPASINWPNNPITDPTNE